MAYDPQRTGHGGCEQPYEHRNARRRNQAGREKLATESEERRRRAQHEGKPQRTARARRPGQESTAPEARRKELKPHRRPPRMYRLIIERGPPHPTPSGQTARSSISSTPCALVCCLAGNYACEREG